MRPLVSVIISNYNYGRYVADAIQSALNQPHPNKEIIVVDDGSTDNSRKIISAFGDRVIPIYKDNGGQASAFNAGFAKSRGSLICLLDSDDVFLPAKIEVVLRAFETCPGGWCFHQLQWTDASLNPIETPQIPYKSGNYDFRIEARRGKCRFYAPSTSGLSFSRHLLQQLLPMPEAITIASDNYLKQSSLAIESGRFLAEPLALQRIHGKNAYTGRKHDSARAHVALAIATGLRANFPQLREAANRALAAAIVAKWRTGGNLRTLSQELRKHLRELPSREKPDLLAHIAYEVLRKNAFLSKIASSIRNLKAPRSDSGTPHLP